MKHFLPTSDHITRLTCPLSALLNFLILLPLCFALALGIYLFSFLLCWEAGPPNGLVEKKKKETKVILGDTTQLIVSTKKGTLELQFRRLS